MTKFEYQEKMNKILESMIGEEVIHESFGIGTIMGFEDSKCIVKYDNFPESKKMSVEKFFSYNEPLSPKKTKEVNELKAEFFLAKESNKEPLVESKTDVEVDNKSYKSNKRITFDDVIGLDNVKELIYQMVVYPYKYKEIYKAFKRESGGGILLYGPPGTGKTMIAKAIANEIDAKFFSIKCSDIASKWFGESGKRIKDLFIEARKYERSILFFDEFEALGTSRDSDSSHSMMMVVSELLSQIDGFDSKENTMLLIASTNKPWNIDSALLRSGRFNKKIYIGLPNEISRCNLLIHELKDIPIIDIDYEKIANRTEGYSSADIVELCNEAKDVAIKRSISLSRVSPITQDDLLNAASSVTSTIVKQELDKLANFSI